MIKELKDLESINLSCLLKNREIWKSLDIDYHPPRVERLWTDYGPNRIFLHVIYPCTRDEALFHPHPWKSAVHLLPIGNGVYEHGIGYKYEYDMDGDQITDNDVVCIQEVMGEMYYEMTNEFGMHFVRPIGEPIYSVMITGPNEWNWNSSDPGKKLSELNIERKEEILNIFEDYFE